MVGHRTPEDLEKDLVSDCHASAERMGAYLTHVGQRKAKGAGTTVGFPDLVLICNGQVVLIELKKPGGYVSLGQQEFIRRAHEQRVKVYVVDRIEDFEALINQCRKPVGVRRRE